ETAASARTPSRPRTGTAPPGTRRSRPSRRNHRSIRTLNEDRAARYQRLKRRAGLASLLWSGALLVGLLATGWNTALRDAAERLLPVAPAFGYVLLLSALSEAIGLPL